MARRGRLIDPVNFFDMLILEKNAKAILTDSGGMQKEDYFMKVPCATLRHETEWVETVETKWNIIAGVEKEKIVSNLKRVLDTRNEERGQKDCFGDGSTAQKIISVLLSA